MSDALKAAAELTPSPTAPVLEHADGRDADRTPLRILHDTTPWGRGTDWHRAPPQDAPTGERP